MRKNYDDLYRTRNTATPQTEVIPGREADMIQNAAGGYVFKTTDRAQFHRFLTAGSLNGTYYATARDLTFDNAKNALKVMTADPQWYIDEIVAVSDRGLAPSNDPALYALALGMAEDGTKGLAADALTKVARTGTHLFTFVQFVQGFRGWGRKLREAVASWYETKTPEQLAYQAAKYQSRNGWTQSDVLRLSHPKSPTEAHAAIYDWIRGRGEGKELPPVLEDFQELRTATSVKDVIKIVERGRVSWEMIPTQFLADSKVWAALLPKLPMTAAFRNLGRMTANGTLTPMSDQVKMICEQLRNGDAIRRARVHPLAILTALGTYKAGHGDKGSLAWSPNPQIKDALNDAFYLAFDNVEPTGKRTLLALDVSGSTAWAAGVAGFTVREIAAVMMMATARSEANGSWHVTGYDDCHHDLDITPKMSLEQVVKHMADIQGGSTNCAIPLEWATANKVPVDTFVLYTDNETYAGHSHPAESLKKYRKKMGIDAKMIVVGLTATKASIADPADPLMLDVCGFDKSLPGLISEFSKG